MRTILGVCLAGLLVPLAVRAQEAQSLNCVAFGDSITRGKRDCAGCGGYPARLEGRLKDAGWDAKITNKGVDGEQTAAGLSRIDRVLTGGEDCVFIMHGTNDLLELISVETIRFNIAGMASKAEAKGVRPVHATTIPFSPNAKRNSNNKATKDLAREIRHLAWSTNRELVPVFDDFYNTPNFFFEFYYQGSDDFVGHPNAAGYDKLAGIFFNVVTGNDTNPPVTGNIIPADDSKNVSPSTEVRIELFDLESGINQSQLTMSINGQVVQTATGGDSRRTELVHNPSQPFTAPAQVRVRAVDLAGNVMDRVVTSFSPAGAQTTQGDLNEDGRVDGIDLIILGFRFGSRSGQPRYRPIADLNSDGVIDGADLAILASNFGGFA